MLNLLSRFLYNLAGNSDFSKKWYKLECVTKYSQNIVIKPRKNEKNALKIFGDINKKLVGTL